MPYRPGRRIKLVTELPMERSEDELMSQQEGACAGCGAPLAPAEPGKKGFLQSIASTKPKQARASVYCFQELIRSAQHSQICMRMKWDKVQQTKGLLTGCQGLTAALPAAETPV